MAESFEKIKPSLSLNEHMLLSRRISEESMTVVRNEKKLIPLKTDDKVLVVFPKIKVVTLVENSEGVLMNLTDSLKKYHQADVLFIPVDPDAHEADEMLAKLKDYDKIIYCSYNASFNPSQAQLIRSIGSNKLIVIALRTPNDLRVLPDVKTYLCSYEATPLAFESLSEVLTGKINARGKLPVTL
jgi:beta-N-acetylhexosaminidase